MVSLAGSQIPSPGQSPCAAARSQRRGAGYSMRTIRSALLQPDSCPGSPHVAAAYDAAGADSDMENLTDSVIDFHLSELAATAGPAHPAAVAKSDIRELIGVSGAIPALVPLLRSTDPVAQESAVTALLNLSLEERNRSAITAAGAIKPLVYALRTGTASAKQNAACALLSLSGIEENRATIGACGAIPPLVALLSAGSTRGKKDALTTLYRLCSARRNKERAVSAGAVVPLIHLVGERGSGTSEKAMVVLASLAGIVEGRDAVVEAGGIPALVETIEDGPAREREFAVVALLQLCSECPRNRALLVREGAIPPLVALSQSGSARAKHKAETLLGYLREQRQGGGGCRVEPVAASSLARFIVLRCVTFSLTPTSGSAAPSIWVTYSYT
uniref:U-box domain-containing protein n=1 Tax=Oryza barthii TaxID=65489 RepID=A0A0D3GSW0_9ORYZ